MFEARDLDQEKSDLDKNNRLEIETSNLRKLKRNVSELGSNVASYINVFNTRKSKFSENPFSQPGFSKSSVSFDLKLKEKTEYSIRNPINLNQDVVKKRYLVSILGCKNLISAGKSTGLNTYIKVYDGTKSIYKTGVVKKTFDPVWQKESFTIAEAQSIDFQIFDKNFMQSDILIGSCVLDFSIFRDEFDEWLPLKDGKGLLHVLVKLTV